MADSKRISKKRKRPSLPTTLSLMGILTRGKSQIHRNCNRSGKSRTHSVGGGNHQDLQPFVKKPKNSSPAEDSSAGYDLSSVSIKDLRLRRVFSPSSIDGVIPYCLDDTENLGKSEVAGSCLDGKKEDCENGDFRKLEMSNEEFGQSTLPDAEIFGVKQVVERNGSESIKRHDGCKEKGFHEERNGMNYSIKSVLKPCSRVKLFKTPGSFGYRRLLPYLKDIKKDCSGSPIMGHCQKTEKGLEEKQLLASNVEEALGEKSMATGCFLEGYNTDSGKELNMVSDKSTMTLVNGEIKKFELQVSSEDQNSNCSKHYSPLTREDSHFDKENSAGVVFSDKMLLDDVEVAKTDVEFPCNARSLEVLDQSFSTVGNKCESCDYNEVTQNSSDDMKLSEVEDNNAEVVEQVEDLNGQCMSMTPPNSCMFSKTETDDSRDNRVRCLSQGTNHAIEKSMSETFKRNNGQDSDKSLESSPKNKLVPNPRLHLKLSKIPGSFSYGRLLPFLIDATNDYSCDSRNDQSLKVEKSSKEKHLSVFTFGKEACVETFNCKSYPGEHYSGDGIRVPAATAMGCSSNDKPIRSPKQVAGSALVSDSQLVKHTTLDANQRLETSPKHVVEPPAMSSSSLISSGLFPREGATSVCDWLPSETKGDAIKSTAKCANHEKQIEADSFGEASITPGIPTVGLKKGILKRNPPGCRGICPCLNCSSFRLHAERSFEFSRNQMQDAEEVVLDLIKELSFLRNILENSAFGAEDQSTIFINEVKEASKKASEAEELAKTRLSQMSYDLNIHCRIPCRQRSSVRFANYVEEQVIPIADSSNK